MKKGNLLLLLTSLLASNTLFSAVGCLARSYHRQRENYYEQLDPSLRSEMETYRADDVMPEDAKKWHPVACNCPCNKYFAWYHSTKVDAAGLCPECMHRGPIGRQAATVHEVTPQDIKRDFPALAKN